MLISLKYFERRKSKFFLDILFEWVKLLYGIWIGNGNVKYFVVFFEVDKIKESKESKFSIFILFFFVVFYVEILLKSFKNLVG